MKDLFLKLILLKLPLYFYQVKICMEIQLSYKQILFSSSCIPHLCLPKSIDSTTLLKQKQMKTLIFNWRINEDFYFQNGFILYLKKENRATHKISTIGLFIYLFILWLCRSWGDERAGKLPAKEYLWAGFIYSFFLPSFLFTYYVCFTRGSL